MKKLFVLLAVFSIAATGFAQTTMPTTDAVLKQAYAQAGKEHKKVILMFHASWCGWCKKMEASLNDPSCKKMFDDNYVIVTLDVLERPEKSSLENPGALDKLKEYNAEKSGLPFWLILDAKGKTLADSRMPQTDPLKKDKPAESIGCPAADDEVAYFTSLLKKTSKLNDEQLAVIAKRFAQNKPAPAPVHTQVDITTPQQAPKLRLSDF